MLPVGIFTLTMGGELTVSDNLTLAGAGADSTIIEADTAPGLADNFRVLNIQDVLVGISNLTIRHGNLLGGLDGGGILNQGTLTVTASTIAHNTSGNSGGGIFNSGGNITVNNSLFKGNVASSGAGIFNIAGDTLTLTESTLTQNVAGFIIARGGGIFNRDSTLELNSSTVNGNVAFQLGGGIFSDGGSITSTNSTVSSNVGVLEGGGIYNQGSATVTMTNSTVTGNISGAGGGVFNISPGTVVLENTIIADHPAGSDCFGPGFTSLGNNLDSNNSCNLTDPGDLTGVAPLLGPLQDNGGPTETHALLSGSPAIDAGNDLSAPPTDQRGVLRPQGLASDIGAFEADQSCTLELDLLYQGGNLEMSFLLGTLEPASLDIWFIIPGFSPIPLVTGFGLPILDPPVEVAPILPFPPLGTIGVLTTLGNAQGITCWALETVDTGTGPSP